MVGYEMRRQVEVVCRCLAKLDERSQENAEWLALEANVGLDFVHWISSTPMGVETWGEIRGAIHCAVEVGDVDTRSLAKFAVRALEAISLSVDLELRARRRRNAIRPPALRLVTPRVPAATETGIRREEAARVLPADEVSEIYSEPAPKGAA